MALREMAMLSSSCLDGDTIWLDRARAFAMHAVAQHVRDAEVYGQFRYTLWTGDLGLAIYLWNCINAADEFPSLDSFFDRVPAHASVSRLLSFPRVQHDRPALGRTFCA